MSSKIKAFLLVNQIHFEGCYRGPMRYLGTHAGNHLVVMGGTLFHVDLVLGEVSGS